VTVKLKPNARNVKKGNCASGGKPSQDVARPRKAKKSKIVDPRKLQKVQSNTGNAMGRATSRHGTVPARRGPPTLATKEPN